MGPFVLKVGDVDMLPNNWDCLSAHTLSSKADLAPFEFGTIRI
jgi:hypothetical protein